MVKHQIQFNLIVMKRRMKKEKHNLNSWVKKILYFCYNPKWYKSLIEKKNISIIILKIRKNMYFNLYCTEALLEIV